jgi:serine/threonine protein kinase
MSSVEIRFKVLELLQADAYGETYRILIGRKRISQSLGEEMPRSNSYNSGGSGASFEEFKDAVKRRSLYDYSEETYTLKVLLHNKFNKTERQHILKKATQLISFTDCSNVGKIVKLFRSANNFFMIFKDPVWAPSALPEHANSEDFDNEHELKIKLNSKLSVTLDESVGSSSKVRIQQPPLNLMEFLIERNKPLNLYEIRTIIYDLLLTLQQLHVKGIPHLDV